MIENVHMNHIREENDSVHWSQGAAFCPFCGPEKHHILTFASFNVRKLKRVL